MEGLTCSYEHEDVICSGGQWLCHPVNPMGCYFFRDM
jgi:hypothetical protein